MDGSARTPGGRLAIDRMVEEWRTRRSYDSTDYSVGELLEAKRHPISIVLPARNVAATVGAILDDLIPLERAGLVDEIVVIDGDSEDETRSVAERRGARVLRESELMVDFGPVEGKGDALWRSLSVASGEIVVFVDADTENFGPHFALGLMGPLVEDPDVQLVKGAYRRPFRLGDQLLLDGGGRVTELLARPWLNLHVPELAGFVQPLAGEVAARRGLLEVISFPVGYGVEIGILLDALDLAGLDALAQVDLGTRQNQHQALRNLSAMAYAVLVAAEARLDDRAARWGRMVLPDAHGVEGRAVAIGERPPYVTLAKPAV
jgi:glucosyl-3-phosphoglycerate synthase